jgi:flagellar biosynthesis/type III secretory pathway protein FliH
MRRSSLPPRMSLPPPAVVITRAPPPAAVPEPPQPRITPAEQEAFAHAALELASLRARLLAGTEAQVLELAVSIAEALIERELERDPAVHVAFARAAVAALGDTRAAKLRVSRAAFRAITEIHGEEAVEVDGVRVELTLDNSLEGLSVVAESGASRVDGRMSERLAAVLRAIEADHRRKGTGDES